MQNRETGKLCDERGREYYFDNAKFMLILLVVLAHFCSPLKSYHNTVAGMWLLINSFHMPCLIFISGYFAKSYIKKDGSFNIQRPFTYLIYYAAAQFAVSLFEYFVLGHTGMEKSFFAARSSLWYLQCLVIWFVLLPYVTKLNKKFLMATLIVIGILVGYDTAAGTFLSVMRACVHFPFFMAGYFFKKEWFFKFRNRVTQALAVGALVLFYLLAYKFYDEVPGRIVTASYNYEDALLSTGLSTAWLYRVGFYVVAFVLCIAFMLIVPKGKTFFSRFGSRTLQVYILHRFIYLAELEYEWWHQFDSKGGCVLMALISVATVFVLSLKPFEYPFKWLERIKISDIMANDKEIRQ